MDAEVQQRVAQALQEQRDAERDRLEQCRREREVEILKFHQKMKHRTELQMMSRQKLIGHSVQHMQLDATLSRSTSPSRSRMLREANRNEAHRIYMEYNRARVERNMLHRQYCIDMMKEKASYRQGLEVHVGAGFALSKLQALKSLGVDDRASKSATFPTPEKLHAFVETAKELKRAAREENEAAKRSTQDMNELDDQVWQELRQQKGKKPRRLREIEYAIETSYQRSLRSSPL
jgi:hypothetical protein